MRILFLLLSLALFAFGQLPTSPRNLDFETGTPGESPGGWAVFSSPPAPSFSAVVVDAGCVQGARCAMLKGAEDPPANWFGYISQSIQPAAYNLRRIRFSAAVRVEGAATRAQLWMRVDRLTGGNSFFDNMSTRPITSSSWARYTIDGYVLDDTAQIVFGVMIFGTGRIWIDDVRFEPYGEVRADLPDQPRPLTETALANLIAFAKVYGDVRHFHPSDQAAAASWELLAVDGIRMVEDAATPQELAERIYSSLASVAPTLRVYAETASPSRVTELSPPASAGLRAVRWVHYGIGISTPSTYTSRRDFVSLTGGQLPAGFPVPSATHDVPIGAGLRASVPISLYVQHYGTVPWLPLPSSDALYIGNPSNRATRLSAIIIAWNIIQHFYPYFDVVDVDWHAELAKALSAAATDPTPSAFQLTLRRMWAAIRDGHGSVSAVESVLAVPLIWDWVEEQLIVTVVKQDQQSGLKPGDRILAIDGQPVAAAISAIEALTSAATPQWRRWRALSELAYCNTQTRRMRLDVEPFSQPGSRRTVEFSCLAEYTWTEPRPAKVAEIEPGIFYVDIDRITSEDWVSALPRLADAKGIVFDLRGYPRTSNYLNHFASEGVIDSAQWHIPTPTMPDRHNLTFSRAPGWNLAPRAPYLGMKKVFLTDGRAISFAESVMGIIEAYKFAEIVGSPTAGTNGNVNPFTLPGGFRLSWTGMKVLKHDGSVHHGVGIAPTIPQSRTRAGIAAGKDEVLLRGIEAARQP